MQNKDIPIVRFTLPNGLRVVTSYSPGRALATVDVLYNVGTRDESRKLTGIAHLFEHLMFGGSANVASFDGTLESAGGKSNAWTSADFTNFYDIIPVQNAATAFFLESDRMIAPDLSDRSLEVQRGVVIEEFKQQCLDQPYGDLMHHLRRLCYAPAHPYSWPTIGLEPDHIARVGRQDALDWFYSHYAPDNAILAVAGGLPPEEVERLARHWFADVPPRHIAPRDLPDEGFPVTDICETIYGNASLPLITMAFPMDAYGSEGYYTADTITDILAVGRSSRFNRNILHGPDRELFAQVDASITGNEHRGLLIITAIVNNDDEASLHRAADIILSETRRLALPGNLSDRELERTLNNFESSFRFSNLGHTSLATNLALAELHGEDLNAQVTDRRRLTPADICSRAEQIFTQSPRITIFYRPRKQQNQD